MNKTNKAQKQSKNTPKAVGQVLTKSHLYSIVIKSNKIKAIDDYIKNSIAPEWSTYYHAQNLNGNTLIVAAANSSVAQKIRLNSMDWLYALRQAHWADIGRIEVKVGTLAPLPSRFEQEKVKRQVPQNTARQMQAIASTMPDELQQAWLNLTMELQD